MTKIAGAHSTCVLHARSATPFSNTGSVKRTGSCAKDSDANNLRCDVVQNACYFAKLVPLDERRRQTAKFFFIKMQEHFTSLTSTITTSPFHHYKAAFRHTKPRQPIRIHTDRFKNSFIPYALNSFQYGLSKIFQVFFATAMPNNICVCSGMYVSMYIYICIFICVYMCVCVYIYICVYIYMCMYVCMFICICVYVYMYVYVCIYI